MSSFMLLRFEAMAITPRNVMPAENDLLGASPDCPSLHVVTGRGGGAQQCGGGEGLILVDRGGDEMVVVGE